MDLRVSLFLALVPICFLRWKSICKYFPWNQFEIPFLSSSEFNLQICFLPGYITTDMVHSVSESSRNILFLYDNDSVSFRLQICFPCFEFNSGNFVSMYFSKAFCFVYDVQLCNNFFLSWICLLTSVLFQNQSVKHFHFCSKKRLQTILFLIWLSVAKFICLLPDCQPETY